MSIFVNKEGNLTIVVENTFDASEELIRRRNALLDLISERDPNFTDPSPVNTSIEMLRDLELTYEQVKAILKK